MIVARLLTSYLPNFLRFPDIDCRTDHACAPFDRYFCWRYMASPVGRDEECNDLYYMLSNPCLLYSPFGLSICAPICFCRECLTTLKCEFIFCSLRCYLFLGATTSVRDEDFSRTISIHRTPQASSQRTNAELFQSIDRNPQAQLPKDIKPFLDPEAPQPTSSPPTAASPNCFHHMVPPSWYRKNHLLGSVPSGTPSLRCAPNMRDMAFP